MQLGKADYNSPKNFTITNDKCLQNIALDYGKPIIKNLFLENFIPYKEFSSNK